MMSPHCIVILLIFNFSVFHTENVEALKLKGKIISGFDGEIEQFPYLASLQAQGQHACGAAIVSDSHLLTAAHCAIYPTEEYSVRVGSRYWFKDGLYIDSIESIISHPKYDEKNEDYDYAVIVLKQPLTFSSTINRIALPAKGDKLKSGEGAMVAGWGTTNATDLTVVSPNFKYAFLGTLSREDCIPLFPNGNFITERMFCAQDFFKEQDACFGDSGGPLVSDGLLIGLVSWGFDCTIDYPGVYSLVSEAIDFLKEVKEKIEF